MKNKDNFDLLLDRLVQNDEGEELTEEDFNELIGDVKDKIDGIKDFLSRCEFEEKRLDETYIKPIQRRKKALNNSSKRLKEWTLDCMEKYKLPVLHGDLFTVKTQEKESVKTSEIDITSGMYLKNKEVIKRKYEFDKTAIKNQMKLGKKFDFAEIVKNSFLKFTVKKGENKK